MQHQAPKGHYHRESSLGQHACPATCAIVNPGGVPHGLLQVHGHFWCSISQMLGNHCCDQLFCFLKDTKDSLK